MYLTSIEIKQLSCKKFSVEIVAGSSGASSEVILTWKVPPKNCSINELEKKVSRYKSLPLKENDKGTKIEYNTVYKYDPHCLIFFKRMLL